MSGLVFSFGRPVTSCDKCGRSAPHQCKYGTCHEILFRTSYSGGVSDLDYPIMDLKPFGGNGPFFKLSCLMFENLKTTTFSAGYDMSMPLEERCAIVDGTAGKQVQFLYLPRSRFLRAQPSAGKDFDQVLKIIKRPFQYGQAYWDWNWKYWSHNFGAIAPEELKTLPVNGDSQFVICRKQYDTKGSYIVHFHAPQQDRNFSFSFLFSDGKAFLLTEVDMEKFVPGFYYGQIDCLIQESMIKDPVLVTNRGQGIWCCQPYPKASDDHPFFEFYFDCLPDSFSYSIFQQITKQTLAIAEPLAIRKRKIN